MALTVNLACTQMAMVSEAEPDRNFSTGVTEFALAQNNGGKYVFLSYETLPANLRDYALRDAKIRVQFSTASPYLEYVSLYIGAAAFLQNAVTWRTKPETKYWGTHQVGTGEAANFYEFVKSFGERDLISPCYAIAQDIGYDADSLILGNSLVNSLLAVTYDADVTLHSQVVTSSSPSYVKRGQANTFSWVLQKDTAGEWSYNAIAGYVQANASFFWREGTSGSFTEVPISGSQQSVTIPANTFPVAQTIQWYVEATDTAGHTSTSEVKSFTTADKPITATPTAPISTIEDGSAPITFRWSYSSPNGTTPTRFDLGWKLAADADYTVINNLPGNLTQYVMPAGTLSGGQVSWRVRGYNADGTAGSWSAASSFVCIAAPATPAVSADSAPFTTITWQVDGQQAYRITVDGTVYGPFFGTDKSFSLPEYLSDGNHSASVEVQGQYGLWSQPGTVEFNVQNTPGDAVTLAVSFGADASLSWTTNSVAADFLIYRDGVRIGHTAQNSFVDRLVLGSHSYTVVNRLPGGNYTLSNNVSGTLQTDVTLIAPAESGEWLELQLSENSMNEQIFNYSRTSSLRHISGAAYPVLELSPYLDGSGTYNTAFANPAVAQAFEALRGRVVILKSRRGNVLIGGMTELRKREGTFFTAFEFTVQRCHWEDYVDDANS